MQNKDERNRVAFEYAKEILTGAVTGVMSVIEDILHPIDNIIYPIGMLAYDALIVTAGHHNSLPLMHPDMPDISIAQQAIKQNPQLYLDAVNRMQQRSQNIQNQVQGFANADGPQRAGMIVHVATGIFVPGKIISSIKAAANLHKYGLNYTPPAFANTMGDLPRPIVGKTFSEIRNTPGIKSYIYVITQDRKLIISESKFPVGNVYQGMHIHHHDLAKALPVFNGGEMMANNGILSRLSNGSGHYLPEGPHLGTLTEKIFRQYGFNEARGIHEHINVFGFLNNKTPNHIIPPKPGLSPMVGHAGGVVGIIAEGLKTQQAEQNHRQQQEAHQKSIGAEKRHQAANLHADRIIHQNVLANNRWYNLPYNSFTPRYNTYDLAWRVEQQAIWEFRLRHGYCPAFIQRQISSQAYSLAYSCANSFSFNSSYSGLADFSLVLMCTNLISSYNSYNYGSYMYSPWSTYGLIGGVAAETATIADMINSRAHALADAFYLCFPAEKVCFSNSMFEQVQVELFEGYKQGTLPLFSLHFNQNSYLYPVLHPAYQNTLIGLIIGFLDYWMKGFLNGGVFDEEFLKIWHEAANCDENYLRSKMVDLKKYCKEKLPTLDYISLRELESRYGIVTKSSNSAYKQPFMTSFRIIAYQEKIERHDNILIPYPSFRIESSVDMMPDYKQYVESYRRQKGTLPPEYQQTLLCYELFAEEIKEKMVQLPFCKDYFSLLGAINSLCYLYTSFEKMGKKPSIETLEKEVYYPFPKALPPIPVRYYQTLDMPLNFKDMLAVPGNSPEARELLNQSLTKIFETTQVAVPETLNKHFETIVTSKVNELLKSFLAPEQMGELNDVDIQKVVNKTTRLIRQIATFNYHSVERRWNDLLTLLPWINEERKSDLEKRSILEKIHQLDKEQESHFQSLKLRWEQTPSLIVGGYELLIKEAASFSLEKKPSLIKTEQGSYSFWGFKDRKWQFTPMEKDFTLPLEWIGQEKVFVSAEHTLFNVFKKAHSLDEGIFSELQSEEEREDLRKEFLDFDTQITEEIKKYPHLTLDQKDKVYAALLQDKLKRCLAIITAISEGYSKFSGNLCESITKASERMLAIPKIADIPVADHYTHSFIAFTGSELAKKMGDNFHIVGGCGLSLPDVLSKPLAYAESIAHSISQIFVNEQQKQGKFKHNNLDYVVYRIAVTDEGQEPKPLSEKEQKRDLSFGVLRAVHEKVLPAKTISGEISKQTLDAKGTTILHHAAVLLSPELFSELVNHSETSLVIKDHYGNLPIHKAAETGNLASIKIMLAKNPELVKAKNNQGVTPLMTAIQYGHLELVQLLHANGAEFNEALPNGLFPLYMALLKNFTGIALWILDNVVNLNVNLQLDSKMTALHLSIQAENNALSLKLLEKGAHSTIPRKSDGHTALHCAAQQGNIELLTGMLNTRASVDLPLESKKTALHLAAEAGKFEAVKLLIQKGANVNGKTIDEETPLMLAIRAGHVEVAKWLATVSMVNEVNAQNQTASLLAFQYNMPAVADSLMNSGENSQLLDNNGFSALYYMVRNGEYSRVKKLLNQGLKDDQRFEGRNLLALAAECGHFRIVKLLEKQLSFISDAKFSLVDYAIMANEVDYIRTHFLKIKNLKSAALLAIQVEATQSLSFLLKKMQKELPFHIKDLLAFALVTNNEKISNLLLKHCDDINQSLDKEANTALHLVVKAGAYQVLPLLVDCGADFRKRNKANQTAFHLAILQKDEDFLKRLFKRSKPEDWPLDLWKMESHQLNEKIIKVLGKYKKLLPEKSSQNPINPVNKKENQGIGTELPPCPVLSEQEYKLVLQFKDSLEQWNYPEAIKALNNHPFLYKVLKSEKGGELLQALFFNMIDFNEINPSNEMEIAFSGPENLLILLRKNSINLGNYCGKQNILLSIIKKQSVKEALYVFDLILDYFPNAIPILARDKSSGTTPVELALMLRKNELFIKLDELCTNKETDTKIYGLHEAVATGNCELVADLIKRYPIDSLNDEGQTPLMLAASVGNIRLINLLLKNRAVVDKCDRYGRNCLYYALDKSSSLEAALHLLPLLKNPNQADRFGLTPFMRASAMGYVAIMRFLFETNHEIHAVDNKGYNAMHYAAMADQVESIAFLKAQQFSIDEPVMPLSEKKRSKSRQQTPLHLAASYAKEDALFELLKQGANPAKEDKFGFNVCEYGILSRNKDMQNHIKRFPWYHDPARNNSLLEAAVMADQSSIVAELILSKANLNAVNHSGQNALHLAALCQSSEAAKLLLIGSNLVLSLLDVHGYSPLHYAAKIGSVRLINLLWDAGAELNQKTLGGETALTLACSHGNEGAVAALLDYGAEVNQSNQNGLTPAQLALLNGYFSIAQQLQEAGDNSLNETAFNNLSQQDRKKLKSGLAILQYNKKPPNQLMRFHRFIEIPESNQTVILKAEVGVK